MAERIERVESQLISKGSAAARLRRGDDKGFVVPVAGGMASYADENSPLNKVAGLGFGGVPTAAELDEIERAFFALGSPVQVELAHLVDPVIGQRLTERGYRLEGFENVLGLAVSADTERIVPAGVEIRPSAGDEFEAWIDLVAAAFAAPDTQGAASHEEFPREVIAAAMRDFVSAAGVARYSAWRDGELAGGASVRISDGVAQLTGAATAFTHRRNGVQTALLTARLADAAAAGCDVAVVTTQPGSKSQQNVQRQGFDLLYTRAVLVKQP
ncbi:GNAT family N-acetyltransferase [Antrihabitans spumae]|uniref:GNAT family N-acetyltransferase n=1 Tax=Antrihabitans spumae TaxID=3373370 RepID=A0ABW7K779_9NOCA